MKHPLLSYEDFSRHQNAALESFCEQLVTHNRDKIQIKKEQLALQNMLRIVRAVISLSQKKGFHGMSLRDLSQETELSMGALYNYFSSKDELFEMIYGQGRRSVTGVLKSSATDPDPKKRLQQAIAAHLYLSEALPKVFSFFYLEARNLSRKNKKNVVDLEQLTESFFEEILMDGSRRGSFRLENPQLIAGAIKALLQDWYLKRYKFSARKVQVEKYADFVIQFVMNNLQ